MILRNWLTLEAIQQAIQEAIQRYLLTIPTNPPHKIHLGADSSPISSRAQSVQLASSSPRVWQEFKIFWACVIRCSQIWTSGTRLAVACAFPESWESKPHRQGWLHAMGRQLFHRDHQVESTNPNIQQYLHLLNSEWDTRDFQSKAVHHHKKGKEHRATWRSH